MASKRVSASARLAIFERDGYRCTYCLRTASEDGIRPEIDHVIPSSQGGSNDPSNLTTSCGPCNKRKGPRGKPRMVPNPRYPQWGIDLKEWKVVVDAIARERGKSRSETVRDLLAESKTARSKLAALSREALP